MFDISDMRERVHSPVAEPETGPGRRAEIPARVAKLPTESPPPPPFTACSHCSTVLPDAGTQCPLESIKDTFSVSETVMLDSTTQLKEVRESDGVESTYEAGLTSDLEELLSPIQ